MAEFVNLMADVEHKTVIDDEVKGIAIEDDKVSLDLLMTSLLWIIIHLIIMDSQM